MHGKSMGILAAALMLALAPFAQAGQPPAYYFIDEEKLEFITLPGASAHFGVLEEAGYRIEVPDNWNGDLVMW